MSFLCSVPVPPLSVSEQAPADLSRTFGPGPPPVILPVPGRVNLIGEHIDYHDLPVLPMAIQRHLAIAFRASGTDEIRAFSEPYGRREFHLDDAFEASPPGDWANYLKAAAQAAQSHWKISRGIDAAIASNLPPAAGLSSSSALLAGFTLAILRANGIRPDISELMAVLPDAEQFVGTRGGSMDHAVVLAAEASCALLVRFAPLEFDPIPIPAGWTFLVAHSLTIAEKSGTVRARYNACREAGSRALINSGFASYRDASLHGSPQFDAAESMAFLHVTSEALRVEKAVEALRSNDLSEFGRLLVASHASLRDQLRVSTAAIDSLVEVALDAGAAGARLTGAGFGGCVLILSKPADLPRVRKQLIDRYYANHSGFDPENHLFVAEPSPGALAREAATRRA